MRFTTRLACCHLFLLCAVASATAIAAPLAVMVAPASFAPADTFVMETLRRSGYTVRQLDFDQALLPGALDKAALLAIPDATRLPAAFHKPVEAFLHRGGNLIAFGLPGWKTPLLKVDDEWVGAGEYARSTAWKPANPLLDLAKADLSQWKRTNDPGAAATDYRVEAAGVDVALHATLTNLTSWDNFGPPDFDQPFGPDETVTVFCAKGGPRTTSLAIEWVEKDGARWIATVPLTTEWRRYELPPNAFKYWNSAPNRGGAGDHLRPENAAALSIGLAFSHTGSVGGRHEYWIGNICTSTADDSPLSTLASEEEIDGLYPGYKSFQVHDTSTLRGLGGSFRVAAGAQMRSPHPRPSGAGFDKGRQVRFIPLLEARSRGGAWRGTPGAMYVHSGGRYKRGIWSLFSLPSENLFNNSTFRNEVRQLARRMNGPFLTEGGTDWYSYFPGQSMRIGARMTGPAAGATIAITLKDSRTGKTAWRKAWPASGKAVSFSWKPPAASRGPWTAVTTLSRGRQTLDTITQAVHIYTPPQNPSFVTAKAGRFLLNGKPYKINGVNYMPSSGVGRDNPQDNAEFEFWMGSAGYDSAIVARDLDNVKRIGLNAISIFIYANSVNSGNLLDILRLCRERGLKADVSLRPGTPMDFLWKEIRPLITKYRLKDNDTVIAYDLAWEPFFGTPAERAKYDALWTKWVKSKYTTIDIAEASWGFSPVRDNDILSGPSGAQLTTEGAWLRYVVDYRAFADELAGDRYARARALVKSVDPNHLVSFRMTETSNPTYNWDANLPYDFRGLGNAVDVFAPEGYGRMGEWEHTKAGWFEVEYARAINPALPVIWKEAGRTAWQAGLDDSPAGRLKEQGDVIATFYRMLNASGSNGVYWWWWPGGHRTGEESDYGIINADGTDRPATSVIRRSAKAFLASPAPVKTNASVAINPSRYSTGLYGAYQAVKGEFWRLVAAGKKPKVVLEK